MGGADIGKEGEKSETIGDGEMKVNDGFVSVHVDVIGAERDV
jgi:hypothetical protein